MAGQPEPSSRVKESTSILVVEDSPEDYEATRRAFAQVQPQVMLHHCSDGAEALDYLFGRGGHAAVSPGRPSLVLLDLNLPQVSGQTVIQEIRGDPGLRSLPIVVLTSSADPGDVRACYVAGANCYVQKPVDYPRFVETIATFSRFWLDIAILPDAKRSPAVHSR